MQCFARDRVLSLCAVLICLSGCGGGASDAPELGEVSGVISYGGKPVVGATVTFVPDESKGTSGPGSSGVTDAEGRYSVSSGGGQPGAVVGWHKVSVMCPMVSSGSDSSSFDASACTVPANVSDLDQTPLTAEVEAEPNTIDFQLEAE